MYYRKITLAINFLTDLENTQLKTPADTFSKEPTRRMLIVMATNQAYLETDRTNRFHYQKFILRENVANGHGQHN